MSLFLWLFSYIMYNIFLDINPWESLGMESELNSKFCNQAATKCLSLGV